MELESYFDFVNENAIRVKGSRVGIEQIVRSYKEGITPQEINAYYPTLTLEEIYATITYYLANRDKVDQYLDRITAEAEAAWQEHRRNLDPAQVALHNRLMERRESLRKEGLVSLVNVEQ